MMNKKTKTAVMLGGMLLSGMVAAPAFAEETPVTTSANVPTQNAPRPMYRGGDRDDDRDDDRKKMGEMMKKMNPSQIDPEKIREAIEEKNLNDFNEILKKAGITFQATQAQLDLLNSAYVKAKAGDIEGAQKILKDNNLDPMLNRFIMGQHMQLTDAQKEAIKKAQDLFKQGKTDEAKAVLKAAGLPDDMPKMEDRDKKGSPENMDAMKAAMEKAKALRAEGKNDEAKQVLIDAGVSEKAITKIQKELDKEIKNSQRKSLLKLMKGFFKFGNK